MKAKKLVKLKGSDLIGCTVMTEAVGEYPGGSLQRKTSYLWTNRHFRV
jgi:hypothetical protein